jgi:hypothetical protein
MEVRGMGGGGGEKGKRGGGDMELWRRGEVG